jgi:hypothetical protein
LNSPKEIVDKFRLGDQTRRSVGGEIPNCRKADHGSGKAANQNVKGVGVGVGHSILHQHEENCKAAPNSRCEISHVKKGTPTEADAPSEWGEKHQTP